MFKKKPAKPPPAPPVPVLPDKGAPLAAHTFAGDANFTTHSATLTKSPLGFGLGLTDDNTVTTITKNSQAERSHQIFVGDRIVVLNGVPLKPRITVTQELAKVQVGATVVLGLQRAGAAPAPMGVKLRGSSLEREEAAASAAALPSGATVPQLQLVKTPGEPTVNELNAWLQAYTAAFSRSASAGDDRPWLAALSPGPVVAHLDAQGGHGGAPQRLFNGNPCAALCACTPPFSTLAKKMFGELKAQNYVRSTAQLLGAGRVQGAVHLHARDVRHSVGGPFATRGALYRLRASDASFTVDEVWFLPDDQVTSIPIELRLSGELKPVKL